MPPLRDVISNRLCLCQRTILVSMSRNKAFGTLLEFWLDILIMFKIVVLDLFFISIISRLYCLFRRQFARSCLSLFLLQVIVFASIKYMVLQHFGCSLILLWLWAQNIIWIDIFTSSKFMLFYGDMYLTGPQIFEPRHLRNCHGCEFWQILKWFNF